MLNGRKVRLSIDFDTQKWYNVYMKTKQMHIRMDEEFQKKLEFIRQINGWKNASEAMRRLVEKEYRKEMTENEGTDGEQRNGGGN